VSAQLSMPQRCKFSADPQPNDLQKD